MLADGNRFTQTHAAIFSHAFFWRVSSALTAFWSSCSNITSGFSLFIPVMFLFPSSRKKVALFHWLSLIQMLTVSVIVSFFVLRTRHEVNFVENKVHLDSIARSRDKKTKPLLQKRANEAAIEKSLSPLEGNIKWSTTNKCWSVYLGMKGGSWGGGGFCPRKGGVLGDQALFPSMRQFFMDRREFKSAFMLLHTPSRVNVYPFYDFLNCRFC